MGELDFVRVKLINNHFYKLISIFLLLWILKRLLSSICLFPLASLLCRLLVSYHVFDLTQEKRMV